MTARRKFSHEIRAQAVAAYMGDEKTESICARLGMSKGSLQRFVREAGARFRHDYNKRQQIISISRENPRLGPNQIAKEVGASLQYVKQVRFECGLRKINHVALLGVPAPDQSGLQSLST